jgi:small subunit ribosomal protein S16
VAVKIRLKRLGKVRAPYYRIVVADSRRKRDGRVIEEIGKYHPKEDPSFIEVDSDRALYWLGVGAQASEPVEAILKVTGDWQKFKGQPAPEPMKTSPTKRDKADIFNEYLKESRDEPKTEAVTARRTTAKKSAAAEAKAVSDAEAAPAADTAAVDEAVAEAEAPVAQAAPIADEPSAAVAESEDAPGGTPAEADAEASGAEETAAEAAADEK